MPLWPNDGALLSYPGLLGQLEAPSDWYSGGRGFDPRVRQHLS